ncbi:MAG TPA: efflux RND transporter permease subunit, partial [Pseudomonadales bacterium]|nr:efflux RND transporter permease subunit [Pseudomonadales bacterium]
IDTDTDRFQLRLSNDFATIENIREIGINIGGKTFRLGDIAQVSRGLADPPEPRFRYNGQDAIGLSISMRDGGDVIKLGANVHDLVERIKGELPRGLDLHVVSDQPEIVRTSINQFVKSLLEAVVIVLGVRFLSLGLRTGMVVALSIPLVLLATFTCMKLFGVNLQRISLGALIIALGLLVDDAIIAVEMMVVKLEEGWDRFKAATFAFESTAVPMLTGTLITIAGFLPVGFANSATAEYCFSIFAVVAISLLISWVVAVLFTPYIGFKILPSHFANVNHAGAYNTPFYNKLRSLLELCLRYRYVVILITVASFVLSILGFKYIIQTQFFPSSDRVELLVDLTLPQGASIKATTEEASRMEKILANDPDIAHFVSYIGSGTTRFYLAIDQQLVNDNYAQFVIVTKDVEARERLRMRLDGLADEQFPQTRIRVQRLENGPPVGFPVQFRVSGPDFNTIRDIAAKVALIVREHPYAKDVNLNWNEMSKQLKLDVDQHKARALGLSSQQIAASLNMLLNGSSITQLREGDQLIDVVGRVVEQERAMITTLPDINIHTQSGKYVPLSQVANISFGMEEGIIWRFNRMPTITVRSDIKDGVQAVDVDHQLDAKMESLRQQLPPGYSIEMGGAVEESSKGEESIKAVMPVMVLVIITLLILQLQNISQTIIVLITAPLGLIGVAMALIAFNAPMGFVANLGVIALSGMIMRNSVILVDQIEKDKIAGKSAWDAIVESTVRRFRPIMLTALAAILAMIPLTRSIFWGPMAMSIMGGLLVATLLTVLFLPALYAAWYRVRRN